MSDFSFKNGAGGPWGAAISVPNPLYQKQEKWRIARRAGTISVSMDGIFREEAGSLAVNFEAVSGCD
jgi:hypothetical protein